MWEGQMCVLNFNDVINIDLAGVRNIFPDKGPLEIYKIFHNAWQDYQLKT